MSNPTNAVTDLVLLHQRALVDLAPLFPPEWKFAWYLRQPDKMPVPCVVLELTAAPPSENQGNIGTEQIQLDLRFEAYVFTDYKMTDYRIKTRIFGMYLAAQLMGRQWSGVANGPIRVLDSAEDRWNDSGAAQYDCWRVEFEQSCLFSQDIFAGGFLPKEIYLGFTPNTGAGHEDDYFKV